MSAPPKPWEVGACNSRCMNGLPGIQNVTDSTRLQSSIPMTANPSVPSGMPINVRRVVRTTPAPAPPPRPYRHLSRQSYIPSTGYQTPYSYGNYGTNYGGYSGMGYYGNGYGGFGQFGGYGMNRYGYNMPGNGPESRFIQLAEESSRPAFQSIESLIHAFGSVGFMLESTFNAVYSSFQAVLSVAENFGRLRSLFGQFFSTFAFLRTLQWLYKKLLFLLGLRNVNPGREEIWQQAATGGSDLSSVDPKVARTSWPILMFMGIMCTGPYLAWKLINSLSSSQTANPYDPNDWKKCKQPVSAAVAQYDFVAETNQELSFKAGQKLLVAPKDVQPSDMRGWLLATADGMRVALVPYNYLRFGSPSDPAPQNMQTVIQVPAQGSRVNSNQAYIVNGQMGHIVQSNQHIPVLNQQQPVYTQSQMVQPGWVPQTLVPAQNTTPIQNELPPEAANLEKEVPKKPEELDLTQTSE